jgi:monothiol glutaredoxin
MKVIAYISSNCAWSGGVCAVLDKYGLSYDKLDIAANASACAEMVRKSGQMNTPCVEIDGVMLADVNEQEVEDYLLANELVGKKPMTSVGELGTPTGNDGHMAGLRMEKPTRFF